MFQQMELALEEAPDKRTVKATQSAFLSPSMPSVIPSVISNVPLSVSPSVVPEQGGGAVPFQGDLAAQTKAAFVLRLRGRGLRDLALLRALEKVPRDIFVPHRYADLAARDISLPIGCGQTLSEPWLIARMIQALQLTAAHRVLEIGTGSGYATAILAEIAHSVLSLERFQSLAIAARLRLETLKLANAAVVFGDGLAVAREAGCFDRIILHGVVADIPPGLFDALAENGRIVLAKPDPTAAWRQRLVEVWRAADGSRAESSHGVCRLQKLIPGLACML